MAYIIIEEEITNAGATISLDAADLFPSDGFLSLEPDGGSVTLAGNLTVSFVGGTEGQEIRVSWGTGFDLNGQVFTINGVNITDFQTSKKGLIVFVYGGGSWQSRYTVSFNLTEVIEGFVLKDASLTLAKFPALERGYLFLGDATDRPASFNARTNRQILIGDGSDLKSVPLTGAIQISNTGVVTLQPGSISNTHISAAAGIAVNKLQALSANRPVVTDANGFLNTASQLTPAQGGFGSDQSAANGFATFSSGTAQVGSLTDMLSLKVSWETNYVGDFKIFMPFAGTVTGIYGFLDKAVGAADALITPKDQSGTTMTSGVMTFTASATKGTAQSVIPTANRTFAAGDVLTFTTSGGSAAGVAQLSITIARTGLT